MNQRWSKKQVQEKVDMFTRHLSFHASELDEKSLYFFTEKLNIMNVKNTKSITIKTEELYAQFTEN